MIDLVFFHADGDYLIRTLPPGTRRVVSGRVESYRERPQMPHPDYVVAPEDAGTLPLHEPVYPLTEGLPGKVMLRAVRSALDKVPVLPEWLDPAFCKTRGWQTFADALQAAHAPQSDRDLQPLTAVRQRLAYDELLANQLALLLIRANMRAGKGRVLKGNNNLKERAIAALPFALTPAQKTAVAEIGDDMASPTRMLRLLQGDVGSGKTIVAFLALLNAVEAGTQGALMVPTEILARQHRASLEPFARAAGIRLALLTGRERGAGRDETLKALAEGGIDILIGTHALFSDEVAFRDLGLAVVDEQHRFGVHQRMTLQAKGKAPADVLVMTATPIPRTLALTAYGDMDVSRLIGRPPGRQPVETRVLPSDRLEEVITHLRKAIARGARAYWVCPLVEESEKIDLAAAEERAHHAQEPCSVRISGSFTAA